MTKQTPTIEELQRDLARADALADQKSNFLATMSHEIRTPMQSVYGLLELIEQEKPDTNILSMVQTAKHSASGLLEILDDILDFAKMDADQMALDMFEVPIRTLAEGIMEALAVKIQGKPIILDVEVDNDVPAVIKGDPKRLRQIIMNLMSNAIKFTQKGRVTIKVTRQCQVLSTPEQDIGLRFEITDSGIGMSNEAASRLFKPFTQADSSTSRKYGGTGLGLSICKKLVDIMDGHIGIISEEGKGSTFWFEIPAEAVDIDAKKEGVVINLDGISILSVEDHPQGAQEILRSLQSMGANVENCGTYAEALELIIHRPFDVAIIDQGLPDGLGLDLIREVMEIRPFMGLIMYTVRDDAGLQHTLQSLGVTYLTKPASRTGLGEAVLDASSKVIKVKITGPNKLLIAEDTHSVRDVLQRQLKKLEVEATFVENGKQALEALQKTDYGILLTDLHMPEMDGYDLVKILREKDRKLNQHFPIIALTADIQMNQRQVYMAHGFDECLLKPVSLGQLNRLLIRWGLKNEEISKTEELQKLDNNQSLQNPALDHDAITKQMGGMDSDTIEMLGMFVSMTAPLIQKIQKAQQEKEFYDLKKLSHSLKGAARSACANILGDYAATLQDEAEKQNDRADLIQMILDEFERVDKEIQLLKTP